MGLYLIHTDGKCTFVSLKKNELPSLKEIKIDEDYIIKHPQL
jgi:hypothetical protein